MYKLKNIQDKYHIIAPGNSVLDLGAAPGSWTEYLIDLLGKKGKLWALDERPLSLTAQEKIEKQGLEFHFLKQSIFEPIEVELPPLDAVVSDVAPWTGGHKLVDSQKSLELISQSFKVATTHLKQGGNFVVKLFQSPDTMEIAKSWHDHFKLSKLFKPASTHKESKEIYFVGRHLKP